MIIDIDEQGKPKLEGGFSEKPKGKACFFVLWNPMENVGGVETRLYSIAKALVSKNWDIVYLHQTRNSPSRYYKHGIQFISTTAVPLHFAPLRFFRYYRLLKEVNADIYLQALAVPHSALVAFFCKRFKRPFVWISGGDIGIEFGKFSKAWLKRERSILHPKTWMTRIFGRLLDNLYTWGIKHANRAIAITIFQKERIERNFGVPVTIIPTSHFVPDLPRKRDAQSDELIVLWVANIKALKRPELFVELAKRCRDLEAKFLMVGYSQDAKLTQQIEDYDSAVENFEYIGGRPMKTVNELMDNASIFVSTSDTEGFPNTFVQAWMRELPVLSLTVDPDGLIHKHNLGYFANGDFDELVRHTRELISNHVLRRKLGQNAREYAVTNFNIEKAVEKYDLLLSELIGLTQQRRR